MKEVVLLARNEEGTWEYRFEVPDDFVEEGFQTREELKDLVKTYRHTMTRRDGE